MITDSHRLQAIDIWVNDVNNIKLTKEEIVAGIKAIMEQKTLYPEAKELLKVATHKVNTNRGVL